MLPVIKLVLFGFEKILFVSFEAFKPNVNNLDWLFREDLAQVHIPSTLLHEVAAEILLVPLLDE